MKRNYIWRLIADTEIEGKCNSDPETFQHKPVANYRQRTEKAGKTNNRSFVVWS